eukprot:SAG11_NODE_196_length_12778_cov_6.887767_10_plen_86_part_00
MVNTKNIKAYAGLDLMLRFSNKLTAMLEMNHAQMDPRRTLTEVLLKRGLSILPLAGPRGPAASPSPSITLLYIFLHITKYSHNLL